MNGQFHAVFGKALKYHDIGIFLDKLGIKGKCYGYLAVRRIRCKHSFRMDFLAVNHKRLAGGFIHEDSLQHIFLAGD